MWLPLIYWSLVSTQHNNGLGHYDNVWLCNNANNPDQQHSELTLLPVSQTTGKMGVNYHLIDEHSSHTVTVIGTKCIIYLVKFVQSESEG